MQTRRGGNLLDELFREDGQTLTALEQRLPMTRFGVMKHLRVLEEAGLVVTRKRGREKLHFLNPVPIRLIHDRWVSKYARALGRRARRAQDPTGGMTMTGTSSTVSFAEGTAPIGDTAVFEIYIKTTPERLWEAITDPEQRAKYSFGVATTLGLERPGSSYEAGVPGVVDIAAGENLVVDPPRLLVQSFTALWSDDVKAIGATRVTWEIEPVGRLVPADRDPRPAPRGRQRRALRRLADDPLRPEDAARDRRAARPRPGRFSTHRRGGPAERQCTTTGQPAGGPR